VPIIIRCADQADPCGKATLIGSVLRAPPLRTTAPRWTQSLATPRRVVAGDAGPPRTRAKQCGQRSARLRCPWPNVSVPCARARMRRSRCGAQERVLLTTAQLRYCSGVDGAAGFRECARVRWTRTLECKPACAARRALLARSAACVARRANMRPASAVCTSTGWGPGFGAAQLQTHKRRALLRTCRKLHAQPVKLRLDASTQLNHLA
jgi:hypothetical protein